MFFSTANLPVERRTNCPGCSTPIEAGGPPPVVARLAPETPPSATSKTATAMWIIVAAACAGAVLFLTLIIIVVATVRSGGSRDGGRLLFDGPTPAEASALWEQHIAAVQRLTSDLKNGRSVEDCLARQQAIQSEFNRKFDAMSLSDDDRRKVYDKYGPKLKAATDAFLDAMLNAP